MKKVLFIILNLISVFIEYALIYLFFRFVLNKVFIISMIMTLVIFIMMIFVVIFANIVLRKSSIEDKNRPCEDEINKIIDKFTFKYNKRFYLHYVSAPQPNPAWCIGNHIYINNQFRCDNVFLPGVVAHELGHVISGISHFTFIPSLKVTSILSRVFHLSITALLNHDKTFCKIISWVLFIPYYIINLNNIIFTYHFLKEDEINANSIAAKLGYGEYLRCYYAVALKYDNNKLFRKSDLMHPSIELMINKLNEELKIRKELLDIYYINNALILANIETKTFTVPSFITEIYPDSINGNNLIKVSSNNVKKVHFGAFRECRNLEIISFKNITDFSISSLKCLNRLNTIKFDDLNIINKIYLNFPNRLFSSKLKKILVNNGFIKEDE